MSPAQRENRPAKQRHRGIWRRFCNGLPEYLARHYWWAYLWPGGVWFFDHPPVINAILFGQYQKLSGQALKACMTDRPEGRMLQLTCAYGSLTPSLLRAMDDELYLIDAAGIQLATARRKLTAPERKRLLAARMNAEQLAYRDNVFATLLIFFLLHELPPAARERTLGEALRVLRPGGRLVIAEYGSSPGYHLRQWLWPVPLLEPFLEDFRQQDLAASLHGHAQRQGKRIEQVEEFHALAGFYRVCIFELKGETLAPCGSSSAQTTAGTATEHRSDTS